MAPVAGILGDVAKVATGGIVNNLGNQNNIGPVPAEPVSIYESGESD